MSRALDVVYFFEHAARELDVACAVTCLLREQGLRVEVVQWPHGFHRVAHLPAPALAVLPFCYSEKSFTQLLVEWRQSAFFNLSWEQLFYRGNQKAKSPRGAFALRHVIHHAWSEVYAQWLRERDVPPGNIFVNGQPAYALYSPPYRAYFPSRGELADRHGLDARKRWVFFPENYNWAFYSPQTLGRFINAGQNPAEVHEMKAFCDSSLRQTLGWCAALARTGEVEIIMRPRPATPLPDFRRFAESVLGTIPAGMHLVQDGTVREWILGSDIVISSHSTSLIEASIAGKAQYMLAPEPIPASLQVDWHKRVKRIHSSDELIAACTSKHDDGRGELARWAVATLMAHGDPVARLADHLGRLARGEVARPSPVSRRHATLPGRIPLPLPILFEARRLFRRSQWRRPSAVIEPEHIPDLAGEREVESRIARWRELLVPAISPVGAAAS